MPAGWSNPPRVFLILATDPPERRPCSRPQRLQVLAVQTAGQVSQVRSKCHCRGVEADVIRFTTGFLRNLGQVNLADISLPVALTVIADIRVVNRRDDDTRALNLLDG